MPPVDRAYTYGVAATLSVATSDLPTAQSSAAEALVDIAAGLAGLSENVELSFPEDSAGNLALSPAGSSAFAVQGLLMIGTDESESAQSVAGDAAAAIATAVSGDSPANTVTLDKENGAYVLQQLG